MTPLFRIPRWRWLAALALLWPLILVMGAINQAGAEDKERPGPPEPERVRLELEAQKPDKPARREAKVPEVLPADVMPDESPPSPESGSPAPPGRGGQGERSAVGGEVAHTGPTPTTTTELCAALAAGLIGVDRPSMERLWSLHGAVPPTDREAAIHGALTLGKKLYDEKYAYDAGAAGACMAAPFERDRFGWIARQNQLTLGSAEGPPLAIRLDIVREAGGLRISGELRPQDAGAAGRRFRDVQISYGDRALSLLGIPFLLGVAWLLSTNRRKVNWRTVAWGVGLQILLGLIVLSPGVAEFFFDSIDSGVKKLLSFSEAGADFVFQGTAPHLIFNWDPGSNSLLAGEGFVGRISSATKTFTFWILPTIVFFSSLMTILYHLGVMQWVVRGFAWAMRKTMKTSGSETLSAAANIFVGQTEAPLVVKPFVAGMTSSELHAIMVGGFATVAGGVMAAYVGFLKDIPGIAGHLVTASIMSAPAALAVAKILYPETEQSQTAGGADIAVEKLDRNVIEAAARGASEGMTLLLNVVAMLIAFVGLMAMFNAILGACGTSLEVLLGYAFSPFAFMMGVPWEEATSVGQLLGEKIVLTEFIAYIDLGRMIAEGNVLSERSAVIASYALCGFSNFASIGIQLGGIGGIAPSRRGDLARVCLRAMFGGFLAANMTGTIAGVLI